MEALHDVVKAGKARYLGASSMWAWRFAKLQHAAERHGWTRFISMQDQYSLLAREEEREMFGLLADQGVGTMPWSPLAGGKVTRPWGEPGRRARKPTRRSTCSADRSARQRQGDRRRRPADRARTRRRDGHRRHGLGAQAPGRHAPIVGATKPQHLTDAAAALDLELTEDEIRSLEAPYTPREPTYY